MSSHRHLNNQPLSYAYYILFTAGVISFTIATLATLPIYEDDQGLVLFRLLLRISSICMILAEVSELGVDPVPKWSSLLCVVSVLGYALYIMSTIVYEGLNKGELYIMAAFCVSVASELKILALVIQQSRKFDHLVRQNKNKFIQLACLIVGTSFFLAGTIILLVSSQQKDNFSAGIVNSIGGCIFSVAALMLFKKTERLGYKILDQEVQIPTIV